MTTNDIRQAVDPTTCPKCTATLARSFEWGGEPPYWCERCGWKPTSQAPVAGADPRADGWRVLAGEMDSKREAAKWNRWGKPDVGQSDLREYAAALRDAAEAVTDLGARLDRACEIAKECNEAQYRAEMALHEATQAAAARGAEGERWCSMRGWTA